MDYDTHDDGTSVDYVSDCLWLSNINSIVFIIIYFGNFDNIFVIAY